MPKVSVLMPVYKTNEAYLREAIESILNQTFTDFEFLILDDCPDDDREKVVKSYQDPRIVYAKNERNLGITPSRNKLIEMAKGEYLAVFDHDDVSLPQRLEKQVAYMDEHPEVGVCGCRLTRMSDHHLSKNPAHSDDIKLALMEVCAVAHSSSMLRRSVLMAHHIRYEEKFSPSEDYALFARLIPYTDFHNLEEVLFHYRDHEGNTSHLQSEKMRQASFAIRAFVQAENPALYREFCLKAKHTVRVCLLGVPLLKMIRQGYRVKGYLFDCLPIFSIKSTTKLQEK